MMNSNQNIIDLTLNNIAKDAEDIVAHLKTARASKIVADDEQFWTTVRELEIKILALEAFREIGGECTSY